MGCMPTCSCTRVISNLLNTVIAVGYAISFFPWSLIELLYWACCNKGSKPGTVLHLIKNCVMSFGGIFNVMVVLLVMHYGIHYQPDQDQLKKLELGYHVMPWEYGLIAFHVSFGVLMIYEAVTSLNAYRKAKGRHASEHEGQNNRDAFHTKLIAVFGVDLCCNGSSSEYSYCLVSIVPALVVYFCANWIEKDPYSIDCSHHVIQIGGSGYCAAKNLNDYETKEHQLFRDLKRVTIQGYQLTIHTLKETLRDDGGTAASSTTGILNGTHNGTHNLTHVSNNSTLNSSMDNIPHIPIGTAHGFLSMDKKRCCVARPNKWDLTAFFGQAGGNMFAAYNFVKFVAHFMLAQDDTAEGVEQEEAGYKTMRSSKMRSSMKHGHGHDHKHDHEHGHGETTIKSPLASLLITEK